MFLRYILPPSSGSNFNLEDGGNMCPWNVGEAAHICVVQRFKRRLNITAFFPFTF
jgi:hypothetical protein